MYETIKVLFYLTGYYLIKYCLKMNWSKRFYILLKSSSCYVVLWVSSVEYYFDFIVRSVTLSITLSRHRTSDERIKIKLFIALTLILFIQIQSWYNFKIKISKISIFIQCWFKSFYNIRQNWMIKTNFPHHKIPISSTKSWCMSLTVIFPRYSFM